MKCLIELDGLLGAAIDIWYHRYYHHVFIFLGNCVLKLLCTVCELMDFKTVACCLCYNYVTLILWVIPIEHVQTVIATIIDLPPLQ